MYSYREATFFNEKRSMIYAEEVRIKIDPMKYLTVAAWLEGYAKGIPDKKAHERLINNLNAGSELLRAVWLASEEAKGGTNEPR